MVLDNNQVLEHLCVHTLSSDLPITHLCFAPWPFSGCTGSAPKWNQCPRGTDEWHGGHSQTVCGKVPGRLSSLWKPPACAFKHGPPTNVSAQKYSCDGSRCVAQAPVLAAWELLLKGLQPVFNHWQSKMVLIEGNASLGERMEKGEEAGAVGNNVSENLWWTLSKRRTPGRGGERGFEKITED